MGEREMEREREGEGEGETEREREGEGDGETERERERGALSSAPPVILVLIDQRLRKEQLRKTNSGEMLIWNRHF